MQIIIGALLLCVVIVMSILLICGLPLGEFTMGGRYKVWPKGLRIVAVSQLAVQIFALYVLLAAGGKVPIFISAKATKITCICFAIFFFFNTVMNLFSTSKKEKYAMTPMSAIEAICFLVTFLRI
ncbi:MAG: hypothetical protein IKS48_13485 [Eubacterium sp.]|nr:hypothetical protein [Eubacterium sp.]